MYTRKSSEEGLEQSFNSLDAQREACQAYILSQRQEGWRALDTHYDDGGFSGGSMERPALKRLLADIDARKIDIVIVYKVDRLTRSLADFAKIIEAFDTHGVSFVSVTQQFNTTSSMGRLTLNVLLSFAQFEREVTGERIRDKIAASKRKGMWMGGQVPLGYDLRDRRLVINETEAEQVRQIYSIYLKFGCVRKLKTHLDSKGMMSKARIGPAGRRTGGLLYSRGALYKILRNRIYVGEIPHKEQVYPGEHKAIIDREVWDKVRAMMAENVHVRRHGTNAGSPSLLCGVIYDEEGNRFTPSHALKSGKRYRYYVSQRMIKDRAAASGQPGRIPARELEQLVLVELRGFFASADRVVSAVAIADDDLATTQELVGTAAVFAERLDGTSPATLSENVLNVVSRIVVHQNSVDIQLATDRVRQLLLELEGKIPRTQPMRSGPYQENPILLTVPAKLKRCGGQMRLIIPSQSDDSKAARAVPSLLKAVARAHEWVRFIEAGKYKDHREIALATGLLPRYVRRILRTAFVAPSLVEAIVEGRQPPELTLASLAKDIPLSWTKQKQRLSSFC